jgi:hypothetical protein
MFDFTSSDANATPTRASMEEYLAQGDPQGGFPSLGQDLQGRVLDALGNMDAMERSEMMRRLREMTVADREQVVGEIVHTGVGPVQTADQGDTRHYTVKSGDSLYKISRAYNVGLQALIQANPQIKNPDLIHPNQVINLP